MEFNINIKVTPEDIAAIGKVIMSDTDDTENQDFDTLCDYLIKSLKESSGNNSKKDNVEIELDTVDKDKNALPRDVEAQAMANAINHVLKRHGFTRDILDNSDSSDDGDTHKKHKATFIDLDNGMDSIRINGLATISDSDDDDDDKE
ncbi:MAG: hypothetical protein [Bacteriophage sp.]|nr:MAG: hypothetical protein [Bacteriophage sp.]